MCFIDKIVIIAHCWNILKFVEAGVIEDKIKSYFRGKLEQLSFYYWADEVAVQNLC